MDECIRRYYPLRNSSGLVMAENDFYKNENKASAKEVIEFHTNDDLDSDPTAHHHTLGPGLNQAASGAHTHRGDDSALLFEGETITGSISNGTALRSVIALLGQLGVADSTTP